jgi:molybdopterin/thiamine biosynthesis adenylyltransferase
MWSRQMAIPGLGEEGQEKLNESRVAVLGLGGVGCPAALYLTAAGIGNLVLVDGDCIQISNLNRQILYDSLGLGRSKSHAAAARLKHLNPDLSAEVVDRQIEEREMGEILEGCDFVLDGFDRNRDRLAVNRVCMRLGVPAVHGFAQDFSGEIFAAIPGKGSCLACAMDESFPESEVTPIIGVATGMVAISMASTAILHITSIGNPMAGYRLIYDLAFPGITRVMVAKNPHCTACSP